MAQSMDIDDGFNENEFENMLQIEEEIQREGDGTGVEVREGPTPPDTPPMVPLPPPRPLPPMPMSMYMPATTTTTTSVSAMPIVLRQQPVPLQPPPLLPPPNAIGNAAMIPTVHLSLTADELREMELRVNREKAEISAMFPGIGDRFLAARHAIGFIARHRAKSAYGSSHGVFTAFQSIMEKLKQEMPTNPRVLLLHKYMDRLHPARAKQSIMSHYLNLEIAADSADEHIVEQAYQKMREKCIVLLTNIRDHIPDDTDELIAFKTQMSDLIRIILGSITHSYYALIAMLQYDMFQADLWENRQRQQIGDMLVDDVKEYIRSAPKNSKILAYAVWYLAQSDLRRGPEPQTVYESLRIPYLEPTTHQLQQIQTGVYIQRTGHNGRPMDFASLLMETLSSPAASDPAWQSIMTYLREILESKVGVTWINEKLQIDRRVLTYEPARYLYAFRNGIWNALNDTFQQWHELTDWPDNVAHYINEEMPLDLFTEAAYPFDAHGIPKKGELPDIDMPVLDPATLLQQRNDEQAIDEQEEFTSDGHAKRANEPLLTDIDNRDWFDNYFLQKLPNFWRIFNWQGYSKVDFIAFAGLQGRVFTGIVQERQPGDEANLAPKNEASKYMIPRFGVSTNIYGVAGTGKSILLDVICGMVPLYKCGILESKEEEIFGRDELFINDVWLIILDELEPDTNLSRSFLKKAMTGQRQKAASKYSKPVRGVINAPVLADGNHKSIFKNDDAGAFIRRFVYFAFKRPIPPNVCITNIDERMHVELPTFMVLALRSLAIIMRLARQRAIWSILPIALIKERDEVAAESNVALEFLINPPPELRLIRDPAGYRGPEWTIKDAGNYQSYLGPYITMRDLDTRFNEHCLKLGIHNRSKIDWEMLFPKVPYAIKPIRRVRCLINECDASGVSDTRSTSQQYVILGYGYERPYLRDRINAAGPTSGLRPLNQQEGTSVFSRGGGGAGGTGGAGVVAAAAGVRSGGGGGGVAGVTGVGVGSAVRESDEVVVSRWNGVEYNEHGVTYTH